MTRTRRTRCSFSSGTDATVTRSGYRRRASARRALLQGVQPAVEVHPARLLGGEGPGAVLPARRGPHLQRLEAHEFAPPRLTLGLQHLAGHAPGQEVLVEEVFELGEVPFL